MKGVLVILSGPSGVGKDTLIDLWKERDPRVARVVAVTTRQPRVGEVDGVDYHFRSVEEFLQMASAGEFLEYKKVHENYYGTPLRQMNEMLDAGHIAILKIDVQGAIDAMSLRPDALTIFIEPPSMDELEARIKGRGTDDPGSIEKRLQNARSEMAERHRYQVRIVNDTIETAVDKLEEAVKQHG